jgi:hypothetical protein
MSLSQVIISYPFTENLLPSVIDDNISSRNLDLYAYSRKPFDMLSIKSNGFGNVLNVYPFTGSTTSINTVSYFSISFNTNLNYFCDIHSISFEVGKGGNSDPRGYVIYSNQDNFTVPIADIQLPTGLIQAPKSTTFNLSFDEITVFDLRIYIYTPIQTNSINFRNFTIYGIVYTKPISNICFPAGIPITCNQGNIPIEKINPDIHTICNKKIVGITKTITQDEYLVCIEKDALGTNVPSQKTIISKNHSFLYKGNMRQAKEFVGLNDNIYKINYRKEVLYNVLMEEHDKMVVNNLICETLHPKNRIAKLYRVLQKLNPEKQNDLINKYNEYVIKNKTFTIYHSLLKNKLVIL